MDWLVFNDVIRLLRSSEPMFDGNYLPSLEAAEALLLSSSLGGCALQLLVLSDGRPSDQGVNVAAAATERICALASRFGRRLSVTTIGFGDPSEPFALLERMADRSSLYGCAGTFSKVSLRPESLGLALSSLAKTLTATRTELTELGGTAQRSVRDVRREPKTTVDDSFFTPTDWLLYQPFGGREDEANGPRRFVWSVDDKKWQRAAFQSPVGSGLAVRRCYFGEGAERIVRKFREVDSRGNFVGALLVAKEGRFQGDLGSGHGGDVAEFHRVFCDAQMRAAKLAAIFNEKLARVPGVDRRREHASRALPRVFGLRH